MTSAPQVETYHIAEWKKSGGDAYLSVLLEPLKVGDGAVVLDLGCGSGYVNTYLSRDGRPVTNIGIDVTHSTLALARDLAVGRAEQPIQWICAQAEALPVRSGSVTHLICRAVLPYTAIPRAVSEIAQSLADGGSLMLLLHPWTMYARKLSIRQAKTTLALLLILAAGVVFHFTGLLLRPKVGRWRIGETFQTLPRMRKLLLRHGLTIYKVQLKPEFLIYARKSGEGQKS